MLFPNLSRIIFSMFGCLHLGSLCSDVVVESGTYVVYGPERTNTNANLKYYLPYNPIIIEIGSGCGKNALDLSEKFPYGQIYTFETDATIFRNLLLETSIKKNIQCMNIDLSVNQSHFDTSTSKIPKTSIDDWIKSNLNHIDMLKLNMHKDPISILRNAKKALEHSLVVVIDTTLSKRARGQSTYPQLKIFLKRNGFEELFHTYIPKQNGEAVFIKKNIFDFFHR